MATGTIILRPSADISIGGNLTFSGTDAYLMINEEEADGQTTFIGFRCSASNDSDTTSASFTMSGTIPQKNIKITDFRFVYVYNCVTQNSSDVVTDTITLSIGNSSSSVINTKVETGTYSDFVTSTFSAVDFSGSDALLNELNQYIESNGEGEFSALTLAIDLYVENSSTKSEAGTDITQVYLELDYETVFGVSTKKNNEWIEATLAFQKQNGAWVEITPEECKSIMQSYLLKVGQLPTYSIVYNLSNCTSNNMSTSIIEGNKYNAIITADDRYTFSNVVIKINSVEVDSSTYWTESETEHAGVITIPNISGNIEIIITTSEIPLLVDFAYTDNGDGTYTLTDWLGTYQGKPSTLCYIPDDSSIIL